MKPIKENRSLSLNSKSTPKLLCVDKEDVIQGDELPLPTKCGLTLSSLGHVLLEDTLRKQIIYKSDLWIWFVKKNGAVRIQKKTFF